MNELELLNDTEEIMPENIITKEQAKVGYVAAFPLRIV